MRNVIKICLSKMATSGFSPAWGPIICRELASDGRSSLTRILMLRTRHHLPASVAFSLSSGAVLYLMRHCMTSSLRMGRQHAKVVLVVPHKPQQSTRSTFSLSKKNNCLHSRPRHLTSPSSPCR